MCVCVCVSTAYEKGSMAVSRSCGRFFAALAIPKTEREHTHNYVCQGQSLLRTEPMQYYLRRFKSTKVESTRCRYGGRVQWSYLTASAASSYVVRVFSSFSLCKQQDRADVRGIMWLRLLFHPLRLVIYIKKNKISYACTRYCVDVEGLSCWKPTT